jgi:metallo-beta-lactamase family protein
LSRSARRAIVQGAHRAALNTPFGPAQILEHGEIMKLTVYGAAREVTGSCHLIETGGRRVLLDCGLFQGGHGAYARNADGFPFDPASIDAVILSHAHIDHSGRLPLLVKQGFRGRIVAQRATRDLCRIMLKDSAFIQERSAAWQNRKRRRKHLDPVEPLYTQDDVTAAMRRFRAVDFDAPLRPVKGLSVTLHPAGHILGASVVALTDADGRRLIFSGDLGASGSDLMPPPWRPDRCDLLMTESTYGDRLHRSREETWAEVGDILSGANAERGNVLIPSFAVGRTQQILLAFRKNYERWGLKRWRIFLDSPLAIEANAVHDRHKHLLRGDGAATMDFLDMENVHATRTANQSMAINTVSSGAIIIAGSGMCEGGRIMHHLKHNLWRRDSHVMIVGFQAGGTLGRRLVDGAKRVSLWGETIRVGARIHTVGGLSAHADRNDLIAWAGAAAGRPKTVIVHGEAEAQDSLADALRAQGLTDIHCAEHGDSFDV